MTRRRVFYIPGYDPFPPRRYRELYRREAAALAAVSGHSITLLRGEAPEDWAVSATVEGARTETRFTVLVWSDLVRASMGQGIGATYLQLVHTAWVYLRSGALFRLMRLRKGPTLAALYPVVALSLQLAGAVAAGLLAARGVSALSGRVGMPWSGVAGAVAGVLAVIGVLRAFRAADGRLYAYYLMHDYAHAAKGWGAYPDDLEARLRDFADRIAAAFAEGWEEVLVVGHSSGAHLGVSVLSDLARAGRLPGEGPVGGPVGGPAVSLLTLGHVVPMISFLPRAGRLRRDLARLSAAREIAWVDVTAPADGCAFALCDPVAVTGVAPRGKRWPLVISAAFRETMGAETWRKLRWRFFRLHFQYLCAFERPRDYDYFAITAGPRTLGARFAGRAPSPSRIETPLSGYTAMDPAS